MQHICYWLQLYNNAAHLLLAAIAQQCSTSVTGCNCTTMQHICYWLQLYNNAAHLLLAAIVQQYDFPEGCHCQGHAAFCEVTTEYFSINL
jgi:hypothetical protein